MASQPRQRLDPSARRQTILAAAIPEFATAGYDRTRVVDIAARVGVTEPVVFQNFGTKSGLFAAVLERASEQLARHLASLAGGSGDVTHILRSLLSEETQNSLHGRGGLGRLFDEASRHSEPAIRRAGRHAHARMVRALAGILAEGQSDGSIRNDVDADALAWMVLSQIHARQFRRTHSRPSAGLEQDTLEALLKALRPEGSARSRRRRPRRAPSPAGGAALRESAR